MLVGEVGVVEEVRPGEWTGKLRWGIEGEGLAGLVQSRGVAGPCRNGCRAMLAGSAGRGRGDRKTMVSGGVPLVPTTLQGHVSRVQLDSTLRN